MEGRQQVYFGKQARGQGTEMYKWSEEAAREEEAILKEEED